MPEQQNLDYFRQFEELEDIPLPEALVSDVLGEMDECADFAGGVLDATEGLREEVRNDLEDEINTLDKGGPTYETVCSVDGSFTSIDGTGVTVGICSAVSAGEEFYYNKEVFPASASQHMSTALQGISTMLEMQTAVESDEEMVIYDGSFVSALVNLNQLLQRREQEPDDGLWDAVDPLLKKLFHEEHYFLGALKQSVFIASPKRSPSSHFLEENYPEQVNRFSDRAFFSGVLEEGEYFLTHRTEQERSGGTNYARGSPFVDDEVTRRVEDMFDEEGFVVCFYKPYEWTRAYRMEIPKSPETIGNYEKIMRTYGEQIIDPSIVEPYPQWLADAMAKKISELSEMMKDGIQNKLSSEGYEPEEVNALLQGYRTEMR
jgi:hypothetical protein